MDFPARIEPGASGEFLSSLHCNLDGLRDFAGHVANQDGKQAGMAKLFLIGL
jgi:hypothetical protein